MYREGPRNEGAPPEASKPVKKVAWWQTPWPWVGASILLTLLNLAQCAANG